MFDLVREFGLLIRFSDPDGAYDGEEVLRRVEITPWCNTAKHSDPGREIGVNERCPSRCVCNVCTDFGVVLSTKVWILERNAPKLRPDRLFVKYGLESGIQQPGASRT